MTYHVWSLCLEEQFYFAWPFLCALALRLKRPYLVPCFVLVCMSLWRLHIPDDLHTVQNRLETRGIGIVFGCAVALVLYSMPRGIVTHICSNVFLRLVVLVTLTMVLALTAGLLWSGRINLILMLKWAVPPITFLFALFIGMLWYGDKDALAICLSWRPLVYLGVISYGVYLYQTVFHELTWGVVLVGISDWEKHIKFAVRSLFFCSTSIGFAALSYHLIEVRFLSLKQRLK